MAYRMPVTRNHYNMFDCASYLQKACRRGLNQDAGFAAAELFGNYNSMMWNRMTFISCEDCSGAFTKEIVKLRYEDAVANKDRKGYERDPTYASRAVYLLTHSNKSRDACYFACNFIIATDYNSVTEYDISEEDAYEWKETVDSLPANLFSYGTLFGDMPDAGAGQYSMFPTWSAVGSNYIISAKMREAILQNDMETAGRAQALLRKSDRKLIWQTLYLVARELGGNLCREIIGLGIADSTINNKRPFEKKDEIFSSKAIMLLCYQRQGMMENLISQDCVSLDSFTDFDKVEYPDIMTCSMPGDEMPEWVFDCHTLRGKRAGKNDWQMNVDEQAALTPLKLGFFDEGTWQSLYEWLLDHDRENPGKFLGKGEYEEHFAYREGRYNNPITKDGTCKA